MEWDCLRGSETSVLCFLSVLLSLTGGEMSHSHSTLSLSATHLSYTCPEGGTVKLECAQRGKPAHPTDDLKHAWLFQPSPDQHCSGHMGPRDITHSGGHRTLPPGLQFGHGEHNLWMILENLTHKDQGRYCCLVLDTLKDHNKTSVVQKSHSHIILKVTSRTSGTQNCTILDESVTEGTVPVVLAIGACIFALLSLPFILLLVYKQRQNTRSSRRAQELVRMDSDILGHENPVFLGGSPQSKTRTVSQIMTRQSSETGRHLLSEPGTPLSPPATGDVFFPIEDTIPESPDLVQV
ncbi:V-type immunoglobulin domain-containing suppressor of T-cell activation [Gouania willdenowi]|uniref:Immunoglobulin domain-containing protein n=1 Tax=Gouania willdenowi TaxID=441366 RepID=A0A8C5HDL1_GOUWI|nr:V-type immunoglobulin domain-containing suppressor of T-cell activation [Gouania willdenowi]